VQATDLAERASHEAQRLADAEAEGDLADARAKAVSLAEDTADALGELEARPGNEELGGRLERRLDRLSSEAARLAGQL